MLCSFRYVPSQGDSVVYEALSGVPPSDLPHALRWYNHITSFGSEKAKFPGAKKDLQSYGAGPATNVQSYSKKTLRKNVPKSA